MTGVAFHYDAPKAQAPQAVLLALPPDPSRNWVFEDLEAILLETLELAKLRGMRPEDLLRTRYTTTEVGSYLPAVYLFEDLRQDLTTS